ncbi:polyprenyl diphosphate synthase [Xanthomonadaceae bacterium JHOS43]|nr:polyprenyl diphosphate synthase [Xanthomonadaceae bacterium JHOS43]
MNYSRFQPPDVRLPRHIAIIMDGNGRWAKARHRPRSIGHRAGARAVNACIDACLVKGIEALTLFAFSSENWQRPPEEVGALMQLFLRALDREVDELHRRGVRVRFIGAREAFGEDIRTRMARAENLTQGNSRLHLSIAADYGGRWDMVQAARAVAHAVAAGNLAPEDIDEARLAGCFSLHDLPAPDLFIRTGGELRISNFLLWQLAYCELYFTDTLWPDFDAAALTHALDDFARRERRFGMLSEQLGEEPFP